MTPRRLKADKHFKPFPVFEGDEFYPNGIFVFNITKLLKFIASKPDVFQEEKIAVKSVRQFVPSDLDEATIQTAMITKPILLAEIAPNRFNVIDGHHRLEKAYRDGIDIISAYKVRAKDQVTFLTSKAAYEAYIQYWNEKIEETMPTNKQD